MALSVCLSTPLVSLPVCPSVPPHSRLCWCSSPSAASRCSRRYLPSGPSSGASGTLASTTLGCLPLWVLRATAPNPKPRGEGRQAGLPCVLPPEGRAGQSVRCMASTTLGCAILVAASALAPNPALPPCSSVTPLSTYPPPTHHPLTRCAAPVLADRFLRRLAGAARSLLAPLRLFFPPPPTTPTHLGTL